MNIKLSYTASMNGSSILLKPLGKSTKARLGGPAQWPGRGPGSVALSWAHELEEFGFD